MAVITRLYKVKMSYLFAHKLVASVKDAIHYDTGVMG